MANVVWRWKATTTLEKTSAAHAHLLLPSDLCRCHFFFDWFAIGTKSMTNGLSDEVRTADFAVQVAVILRNASLHDARVTGQLRGPMQFDRGVTGNDGDIRFLVILEAELDIPECRCAPECRCDPNFIVAKISRGPQIIDVFGFSIKPSGSVLLSFTSPQ